YNDILFYFSFDYYPILGDLLSFPTRRSSDLSWSRTPAVYGSFITMKELQLASTNAIRKSGAFFGTGQNWDILQYNDLLLMKAEADRKSTRLNSSHVKRSYAVLCLKIKKKNID